MLSVYAWCPERQGEWLEFEEWQARLQAGRPAGEMLWVDLEDPTPDEEEFVFKKFLPIHPLILEDVTKTHREPGALPHLPKVEDFGDYLFVVVNPLAESILHRAVQRVFHAPGVDEQATTQLSAVLTRTVLVTHHYQPMPSTVALRAFLTKHDTQGHRGPDFLFHVVLDTMVDQYVPVLDHFDEMLDEIEVRVIERSTQQPLKILLQLKRAIIHVRKTLIYEREVVSRLSRGEFQLIDEREAIYYRNVHDHLVRFTELIESSREMVSDLMQLQLSAASNRLNEVMKVLAMISTVFMPMSLVAGIYGMNFEKMAELKWAYGYYFALGLMALIGVGSFSFFRWRKWF